METQWELEKPLNTPTLPQKKKKNLGTWVHAASPHWLQECFGLPIFLSFLA
jgi:hypothetical protein